MQQVVVPVTVDMTSKCESVSVSIETVLGVSDKQTGQINATEKFDLKKKNLSEASVTELSLVENQSTCTKVRFRDDYCNHTGDRGHAAFHEELDPDVIRGKLRDKVCSASHHKPVRKQYDRGRNASKRLESRNFGVRI